MPKLSAILSGSTVLLPLKGGGTYSTIKVTDNHYGLGETVLLGKTSPINSTGWFGAGFIYTGAFIDRNLLNFQNNLSKVIQESLVYPTLTNGTVDFSKISSTSIQKTETFYRACFLPSYAEIRNASNITFDYANGGGDTLPIPTDAGTLMSGLEAAILKTGSTTADGNSFSATLRNVHYGHIGNSNYSTPFAPAFLTTANKGSTWTFSSNRVTSTATSNTSIPAIVYNSASILPLITIDSNVEVANSNGGIITKGVAVESYRKIDGVWYRTT